MLRKKKDDQCFCESCNHKTANECIDLGCQCCLKAAQIMLNHPAVPEDDFSEKEKRKRQRIFKYSIRTGMVGGLGSWHDDKKTIDSCFADDGAGA